MRGVASIGEGIRVAVTGANTERVDFDAERNLFGKTIKIVSYSGLYNNDLSDMPDAVKENYEKALNDYETIRENYNQEKYPSEDLKTLGEQALTQAIRLSEQLGQKEKAAELCEEFDETYDSLIPPICNNLFLLSNLEISSHSVLINGKTHSISFEGIDEPDFEEFGITISVRSSTGAVNEYDLTKNEIQYISDTTNEYIQLVDLENNFAVLKTNLDKRGIGTNTINQRLELDEQDSFDSNYVFSLKEINLEKVAKVSLNPHVDYARTNATFNFKIGIEKRNIQLSPEKTREKIDELNETLEQWNKISDGLGTVVEAGKLACIATGGALTIKNFFANLGGKGAARQEVMRAEGGYYDQCKNSADVEACLLGKADDIEASVNAYEAKMSQQNQDINTLEEGISDTRFLGEKVVDTDALADKYMTDQYRTEITTNLNGQVDTIDVAGDDVNVAEIIPFINPETTSISQARSLQLHSRLLDSSDTTVSAIAKQKVEETLGEIYSNTKSEATRQTYQNRYGIPAIVGATEELKEYPVSQLNTFSDLNGEYTGESIDPDSNVVIFVDEATGSEHLLVLNDDLVIEKTYTIVNGRLSITPHEPGNNNPLGISLKKYDLTSYDNQYLNPQVKYYETAPYQGLPAIVPFDTEHGWYAAVKSSLPLLGNLRAYDESGRVSSFYVCNVGANGEEENIGGDDICRGFVPQTGQTPEFPGLDERDSARKMDQAVDAIEDATRQYDNGVRQVTIDGNRVEVGEPAANIPDIQCEDFMSPTDCNLMFNVCDPVICPSSRCDLGGRYPVKDVIQSGIAGSIALCLPNWPEVKVPICVSGVHAGLEGYLSVVESYQQCLQTSLDTGQTVGICDELNSVYMCEFFWRQGLPIAKFAIGNVVGNIASSRGGGEYLGVSDALETAEQSVDYFSQYYAANSYKAFQARSAEGVGGEICKNWVSVTGPEGNFFDALTAPDSPSQFYGRFEEIPYSTATNPPTSQYKVFYHIYAGKDVPAYYQVYLKGTGSSFFQDTNFRRPVASGFIPTGEFGTATEDFTAPSGYQELCIVVNGQEQCGFKQVTTEFGVNFISDQYVAQQASQTNIQSEAECVSGSPSAYSLLNPNIQSAGEDLTNPAIYNRGIIRVCSTENPGLNEDSERWSKVGNCGSENLGCWLDSDSVKNVVKDSYTQDQILSEVEGNYLGALDSEGQYMDEETFSSFVDELNEISGTSSTGREVIEEIDENIDKTSLNNQRAYLHLRRGISYTDLAIAAYNLAIGRRITVEIGEPEVIENPDEESQTETPVTGNTVSCTNTQSCQQALGEEIIKLALEKKQTYSESEGISLSAIDSRVKSDTGAKNFECLVLQVAMTESTIRHCTNSNQNGDPLYCDDNKNQILTGDEGNSLGVMQINSDQHGEKLSFEENVNFGIDLLTQGYDDSEIFRCYPQGDGNFVLKAYTGWNVSLRGYNGWSNPPTCDKGNLRYVDDVANFKDEVAALFPECR